MEHHLCFAGHMRNGEPETLPDGQMNFNERQKEGETSKMIGDTSPTTSRLLEHRQLLNEMSKYSALSNYHLMLRSMPFCMYRIST